MTTPPTDDGPYWVFAYGSLMWRPDFDYLEVRDGTLRGYHRSLCIYSWVHRGTPEVPGLVFGLDRGGACKGRVFRVEPAKWPAIKKYLDDREMVTAVYEPRWLRIDTSEGPLTAYCFTAVRSHEQYAGALSLEEQARFVRQGRGRSGINIDYVRSTVEHMQEIGVHSAQLKQLMRILGG
jgi:cation transport protein ChaC